MADVMKMMVITSSAAMPTITLPTDWNPLNNTLWGWGAGANGRDAAGAFDGGFGGGAGGFDPATNIGGASGDILTLRVGVGNGGKTNNSTRITHPSLGTLLEAQSANTSVGGGGDATSIAGSNSGGFGEWGGGGGGGAPGPHISNGTKGGAANSDGSKRGGGGGAGAVGDFSDPDESLATNGNAASAATSAGANGGTGYYGNGAGAGGVGGIGSNGTTNLGGGGGGGQGGTAGNGGNGFNGGAGASCDYILGLTPNVWITAPFSWTTSPSGRWAIISTGIVIGGAGGGGGGSIWDTPNTSGAGGAGGFPGGGGGGAGFNTADPSTPGGAGAGGLIIIFYLGQGDEPTPTPESSGGNPYYIERMDNRIWPTIEAAWCVDSGLRYPMPEPAATLFVSSATGDQEITEYTIIDGGSGYSAFALIQTTDLNPNGGTGAAAILTVTGGVITAVTPTSNGSGYINPQSAVLDSTGVGAVIQPIITNYVQLSTNTSSFTASDAGSIIRVGGGKLELITVSSVTTSIANIIVPITTTVPNDPNSAPVPAKSGSWSMTAPTTTVSGLAHLAGMGVVALADGGVVTGLTVDVDGKITLPAEATAITVGLPFVAQLQTMYMDLGGGPTVQTRRKDVTQVVVRVENSLAPEVGLNQPDAAAQPGQAEIPWGVYPLTGMTQIRFRTPAMPAGQPQPLFSGDLDLTSVFSTWDAKGQIAIQQRDPIPLGITGLVSWIKVGDSTGQ